MAMQRSQAEVESQFECVSGYRCVHCNQMLDAKGDIDRIDHLLECIQYIKKKHPGAFAALKRYDVTIISDKYHAGKFVQNGLEEDMMQGIKKIISGIRFEQRGIVKIHISEATG